MKLTFKLKRVNSFLFSFFLFQYSFCAPLSLYIGNQIPVIISTVFGGAVMIFGNVNKIDRRFYLYTMIFLSILLIQFLLYPDIQDGTLSVILFFLSIGILFLFIGCCEVDYAVVEKYCIYLAVISYFLLCVFFQRRLIFAMDEDVSMRFGYALLPSLIFFLYQIILKKTLVFYVLFLLGFIQLFIWGSRGCMLSLMLFYLLYVVYNKKITFSFISILFFILLVRDFLIELLLCFIRFLPFETRKIANYLTMFTEGLVKSSSGRDKLYESAWNLFCSNPWGYGAGYYNSALRSYPHNLFLEIAVEWGILGASCAIIYFFIYLYRVYKIKYSIEKNIIIAFSAIMLGRLLVSSSYWERPEFWMCLGVVFLGVRFNKKVVRVYK